MMSHDIMKVMIMNHVNTIAIFYGKLRCDSQIAKVSSPEDLSFIKFHGNPSNNFRNIKVNQSGRPTNQHCHPQSPRKQGLTHHWKN